MNMRKVKEYLKKPGMAKEVKELELAMEHAKRNQTYNKVCKAVLEKAMEILEENNIKEFNYMYENKEHKTTTKQVLDDLDEMSKEGFA